MKSCKELQTRIIDRMCHMPVAEVCRCVALAVAASPVHARLPSHMATNSHWQRHEEKRGGSLEDPLTTPFCYTIKVRLEPYCCSIRRLSSLDVARFSLPSRCPMRQMCEFAGVGSPPRISYVVCLGRSTSVPFWSPVHPESYKFKRDLRGGDLEPPTEPCGWPHSGIHVHHMKPSYFSGNPPPSRVGVTVIVVKGAAPPWYCTRVP